jgi:beta-xylosidase
MRARAALRALAATGVLAAAVTGLTAVQPSVAEAAPPVPQPVYAPAGGAADPGVVRDGNDYFAFTTGGNARVLRASTPQGPWEPLGDALSRRPAWASSKGAVWAPDAVRTDAGWVLYYALQAKGFSGQRCIGTAVAERPEGPYEPNDTPLVCPKEGLGGEDTAPDRPDQTSGVIDPAPFRATDGQRYLTYKTQKTPGTLRMVPLTADAQHARGTSHELLRHADSIENPVMVQRGDWYVLFAAANWYDQCRYTTVWLRSTDMWSWTDKAEHTLLDQASTGLCGPGGADVVASGGGPSRIVLHGWLCPTEDGGREPCQYEGLVTDPAKRRALYAAVLTWGDDGATPAVPAFLPAARSGG